ncbi:SKIP/SNW domain-containing protein [Umbelopsis sp. AD052]|nr:SKIP/SNW domain-containing protein [Umbelopsis sp. AD052]
MATLSSLLPKPQKQIDRPKQTNKNEQQFNQLISQRAGHEIPPYGQRQGFKPRTQEDFGNGGAFPEVHIAQYPLDMGRKQDGKANANAGALTLQVDAEGKVKYDAIARQGHGQDRVVHSQFKDLVPLSERKDIDVEKLVMDRPSEEEVQSVAEKTRAALEKIVSGKISAAKPKNIVQNTGANTNKAPTYIRYTPGQGAGDGHNSGAKQRIIRMVDAPVDPMEPPQFKHKKIPKGPGSPPAPVLHSPPRKLTAKEQAEWVIPPSISNWKNTKGYTIPLDKRLAADGRGLQEVTINDNFAKFAEALYAADRHAREEVRQRNLMQQKLAQKQKESEEDKLRALAQKAREERAGLTSAASGSSSAMPSAPSNRPTAASMNIDYASSSGSDSEGSEDEGDDAQKVREREELRKERQKQRERELRMSKMGTEARAKHLAREQGRDISEKIALGLAKPSMSKESMFDSRLFNQSEGISSGFRGGDDEAYTLYDKKLFAGGSSSIYRPKMGADNDYANAEQLEEAIGQDKFGLGNRGFKGTDGGQDVRGSGPVEFEKEQLSAAQKKKPEGDVFGLDTFLNKAKKGKRGTEDDIDEDDRKKRR